MFALVISDFAPDLIPIRVDGSKYGHSPRNRHRKHPCTLWIKSRRMNAEWALQHLIAMNEEWAYRKGKPHSTGRNAPLIREAIRLMPETDDDFAFQNCSMFKDLPVVEGYRLGFVHKWRGDKRAPKWTLRGPPIWLPEYEAQVQVEVPEIQLQSEVVHNLSSEENRPAAKIG